MLFLHINKYIENPAMVAENQEPTHVPLMPFADKEAAKTNNWNDSPYYKSLNGQWKFLWVHNPEEVPDNFYKADYNVSVWDNIKVPSVWQTEGYGHNMYRNIPQALQPFDPPNVPDELNPTGCYRTTFSVPESWAGQPVFLHFEGVKSASFVWINGHYVGYDQGGMTPSEYNISKFLQPGDNSLSVEVIRWSDGSYLEDQDMWRFAGIYRSVYLFSTPTVHIRDFFVKTDLDAKYEDAVLSVTAEVQNYSTEQADKITIDAELFDKDGQSVAVFSNTGKFTKLSNIQLFLETRIKNPLKWSAEKPNLYKLILTLKDADDQIIEVLSEKVGFRKLEIKGNMALINGVAVDFMGVNKHEHHPEFGRTMPEEMIRKDLELMKQFNVNAVRTCHYPNVRTWYELCDEYGIYVQDEVNAECHYAENWYPSVPGLLTAYMDRWTRMIQRDKNHPSIVMWSTGNECGTGYVHFAMADWVKMFDPSRFLMHQNNRPAGWAPYVDIWGPRYFSPARFRKAALESDQPIVSGEYSHAMGNSMGHFDEYWDLFREFPNLQGGFIWDWVDQGLWVNLYTTPDQSKYGNNGYLMGRPKLVEGKFGQALEFSGLDDYVEIYRDPSLDITGDKLTLELWVYPRNWENSNPLITKGETAYGLQQVSKDTLEFYIYDGKKRSARAYLPHDWKYNWHHVAGVYDGKELKLILDGKIIASRSHSGNINYNYFPVCIGRNIEKQNEQYPGWLSNSVFDQIRVYNRALDIDELSKESLTSNGDAVLWLNFDEIEKGEKYLSYGASPFCINGVIFADRTVQPETWQMKKSHAPVRVKAVDLLKGRVNIYNYFDFTNLNELKTTWILTADDREIQSGILETDIPPRSSKTVDIPFSVPELEPGAEYWLTIRFLLAERTIWADEDHEITFEQFKIPFDNPASVTVSMTAGDSLAVAEVGQTVKVQGPDFSYIFNSATGTLESLTFKGSKILKSGPRLNVFRAPILNEWSGWGKAEATDWYKTGLDKIKHTLLHFDVEKISSAKIKISVQTISQAPGVEDGFVNNYTYNILACGDIVLEHEVKPFGEFNISWLPKVGLQMTLNREFDTFTWYGRGPVETYPDRKTGTKMGVYSGSVQDQYVPYVVPQDHGNKTDVRWASLTNKQGVGLAVFAKPELNISVTHYDNIDRAVYAFQLRKTDSVIMNLDFKVTGVGGTPVGTRPIYRTYPDAYRYTVRLKPVDINETSLMKLKKQALND
ncbi:DUF4981 domain-containing protein [candidate division KSB1 bacterium]|nr:DUF4981 domain-containing protein [candidate division KSB1 bacterium]